MSEGKPLGHRGHYAGLYSTCGQCNLPEKHVYTSLMQFLHKLTTEGNKKFDASISVGHNSDYTCICGNNISMHTK